MTKKDDLRDCTHCIWHTDGRCASWDCEYISRKEALEALEKVKDATPMVLPPEQPEIIRCKDCKWWDKYNKTHGYCLAAKHGYWSKHWEINIRRKYNADWYCADAERKTDEETNIS